MWGFGVGAGGGGQSASGFLRDWVGLGFSMNVVSTDARVFGGRGSELWRADSYAQERKRPVGAGQRLMRSRRARLALSIIAMPASAPVIDYANGMARDNASGHPGFTPTGDALSTLAGGDSGRKSGVACFRRIRLRGRPLGRNRKTKQSAQVLALSSQATIPIRGSRRIQTAVRCKKSA